MCWLDRVERFLLFEGFMHCSFENGTSAGLPSIHQLARWSTSMKCLTIFWDPDLIKV